MAQPFFNHEHFVQEQEELVEPIELDKNEQPSPPSIELKPLPSGLRYVFMHNNPKTPVIISDKLSDYETNNLSLFLKGIDQHLANLSKISWALVPFFALIVSVLIPILHLQGNHNGDLTMLCERLLRKRSVGYS